MERMYNGGIETYFAKGGVTCLDQRFVFWVENGPLTNDSGEHTSKDHSFAGVVIVRKRQTLFETTFTVGRD